MQQMWLSKASRKIQQPGRYQTTLGMVFYHCSDHLPQAHTGPSTHKFLLGSRDRSRRKERNQVETALLIQPSLYKRFMREAHFRTGKGIVIGNGNKEVGNSTLLAGAVLPELWLSIRQPAESPQLTTFKSGNCQLPRHLQS